jgi:hypothetical protein
VTVSRVTCPDTENGHGHDFFGIWSLPACRQAGNLMIGVSAEKDIHGIK